MLTSESLQPIKIEYFKTQSNQLQTKLREKQDEHIKLQEEFHKLNMMSQKIVESKIKMLNELTEQKSKIKLLEGQIDIKKKYLNSLIQDTNDEGFRKEMEDKQEIQRMLANITEATIKGNDIIRKIGTEIGLREIEGLNGENIELILKNIG